MYITYLNKLCWHRSLHLCTLS